MPTFRRNDVDPDRMFVGDINRVVAPGETVEADLNPGWPWFDDVDAEPFGTVVPPVEAPPVVEEPAAPADPSTEQAPE